MDGWKSSERRNLLNESEGLQWHASVYEHVGERELLPIDTTWHAVVCREHAHSPRGRKMKQA